MRRADRLFQIVQRLHPERVITAARLAEELEVSERTIYRDIQDLSLSGVPVTGEAGHGYHLLQGYQLPPLMFNAEELQALLLGARMVKAWSDPLLARATETAISKIEAVIPERLQPELNREHLLVPNFRADAEDSKTFGMLRETIARSQKLQLHYRKPDGVKSNRKIWPLGLFFWGTGWTLVGWCELRNGFRNFRIDRMLEALPLEEYFETVEGQSLQDYLATACGSGTL